MAYFQIKYEGLLKYRDGRGLAFDKENAPIYEAKDRYLALALQRAKDQGLVPEIVPADEERARRVKAFRAALLK